MRNSEAIISTQVRTTAPTWPQRALPLVSGAVLILALLLGGGTNQGLLSDTAIQLASLPLIGLAVAQLLFHGAAPKSGWAIALLILILVLPMLQLIPLRPDWWVQLPGRASIASAYDTVGIARPWLPISLTPAATVRSALSLLPATAIFLAMMRLAERERWWLTFVILLLVLISVAVDLLQVMHGPDSPLYFYEITNKGSAVGFFANRNHNAALLYAAIPLAAALGLSLGHVRPAQRQLGLFFVGLVVVGAVLGLAITGSRAGLALGLLAGLTCIVLTAAHRSRRWRRTRVLVAIGGNLLALVLAFQFGFVALATRLEHSDLIDDIRWPVAKVTFDTAQAYDPVGTGFGSFVPIFQSVEPRDLLATYYINHAHNDWLELWLDGGIPALALAALFLLWFFGSSLRVWFTRSLSAQSASMGRAGSTVIFLLLLHSIVDYPLRTTALMVLFAFCAGLLIPSSDGLSAPER
jgi:O-antigen ligase